MMLPGRVYRGNPETFWSRVKQGGPDECWLWQSYCFKDGYGCFYINRRYQRAHRVSWQLVNGKIPVGLCVLHHCDTPLCVNPRHLFLGTNADNATDKVTKGRHLFGEKHPLARLTGEQVIEIRQATQTLRVIAQRFNVSQRLVGKIKHGEAWSHVPW